MKAGRLTERDGVDWEENKTTEREVWKSADSSTVSKIMGREDVICVAF